MERRKCFSGPNLFNRIEANVVLKAGREVFSENVTNCIGKSQAFCCIKDYTQGYLQSCKQFCDSKNKKKTELFLMF